MNIKDFNSEKINLFGIDMFLTERPARDVNNLLVFSQKSETKTFEDYVIEYAVVVEDGLKYFVKSIPKWQFWRRLKMKKICKASYLISNLPAQRIYDLATKVYELEGIDVKKKSIENQQEEKKLAEKSETD